MLCPSMNSVAPIRATTHAAHLRMVKDRPGMAGRSADSVTSAGGTESAAESAALTNCRSGGFSCNLRARYWWLSICALRGVMPATT